MSLAFCVCNFVLKVLLYLSHGSVKLGFGVHLHLVLFIRTNFDESSAKISAASASHDAPKVDASRVRFLSCSSDAPSIGVSA